MKLVNRYCKACKKITVHTHEKEEEGAERFILVVATIGLSELWNGDLYMCTECEKEIRKL